MFYSVNPRADRKRNPLNIIGRYLLNLTFTGNTSVTVPTSGTLVSNSMTASFSAGYTVTPFSAGTKSSGTFTPDPTQGNQQYITANGAFTLAPQTSASQIIIEVTNGATAGAITTTGYTKVTGDTYATTNANKYLFFSNVTQTYKHLNIVALQ